MSIDTTSPRIPSGRDRKLANRAREKLAAITRGQEVLRISLKREDKEKEEEILLPSTVLVLLQKILEETAAGRAVTVFAQGAELTTQEAADMLNVSRPYLIRLLEKGELSYRMVGTHRRIPLEEVLRYKDAIDTQRRKILGELVREAQELGLGY